MLVGEWKDESRGELVLWFVSEMSSSFSPFQVDWLRLHTTL
jgi:hypothetical protein